MSSTVLGAATIIMTNTNFNTRGVKTLTGLVEEKDKNTVGIQCNKFYD